MDNTGLDYGPQFNGRTQSTVCTPYYHLELERNDIRLKVLRLESSMTKDNVGAAEIARRKQQITAMSAYAHVLDSRIKAIQGTDDTGVQDQLIDAAEMYADKYLEDDRPDTSIDILNAFYAGSRLTGR